MYFLKTSVIFLILIGTAYGNWKKHNSPPHCTHVSKETDYTSRFKMDYPIVYIHPGHKEAYQQMYCLNPPQVNKAATTVCDWAAPPQVHFTLGDEYMHVIRQDPTGKFNGNVIIKTYQLCSHKNISSSLSNHAFVITDVDNY